MNDAIIDLVGEMRWRVRAILRVQRMHSITGMMNLYKAKVLSYAESRTAAIYHDSVSALETIDKVQRSFLVDIGVDEISALLEFNLATLGLRRDIAMFGLIHRTVLGQGLRTFRNSCSQKTASTDAARDDQGTTDNCTNTGKTIIWMRSGVRRWA